MIAIYIDVQNLHKKTLDYGRKIDRERLYIYLSNKYKPNHIYYAVWYISSNEHIYARLKTIWYTMLFKETIVMSDGQIKWNVDIDIAIKTSFDICRYGLSKAYLITNDGDYNTLIQTCIDEGVFGWLVVADRQTASHLIKKFKKTILDIQDIKVKIQKTSA